MLSNGTLLFALFTLCTFFSQHFVITSQNHETPTANVTQWAADIGNELWEIGKRVTKLEDIKDRYKEMNATVEPTDGYVILKTIVTRMNKLIKEKVDAVMNIKNATEKAEQNFTNLENANVSSKYKVEYRNSKFSEVILTNETLNKSVEYEIPVVDPPNELKYPEIVLTQDPHFNDVLVNTSYSSVHVPTNIFDRWDRVIDAIHWSESIDEAFRQNFETDSSLMWQYFASTSGFLRHFPAFRWNMDPDEYDCRTRIWYIQAATCSKEAIILVDNSGTMYGMRNTIAQLTVDSLLRTFSNNDYVNVYRLFNGTAFCLVPCFNDTLVQATPENVELFKTALYKMCPELKINFASGFKIAFEMLHNFTKNKAEQSERRNQAEQSERRNQAIFLLTDMLPTESELTEIRQDYEKIYSGTNIEVELFIYLIGKDVPEVNVVQWRKCLSGSSIVHVRTMDEVPEDVLKYLTVIARTQNENTIHYPVSWTHVFLDIKRDKGKVRTEREESAPEEEEEEEEEEENEHPEYGNLKEPHIMTAVTAPVYSKKKSKQQKTGREEMIGVAAIDVPVSNFEKLTIPHKIGVNGYAFVVTNNGYLLFHPDLTPVKNGIFRENFNSVDLTEVEFYDDNENEPRKPHERIYELRKRLVNQEVGQMANMAIKFHYDNQTRVGSESRNYFFAPLKCSPFSLGLALPRGYGNYWIKPGSRIHNEDYSNFFTGKWKIHPKWTYCDFRDKRKYNQAPKEKLLKFFDMIFDKPNEFKWYPEHVAEDIDLLNFTDSFESCFYNDTTEKPPGEYFCDEELMELLFFDAKLTSKEFIEQVAEEDMKYMEERKIRIKFVATQSGLTRWLNFTDEEELIDFTSKNDKALDEVWYKSAVLLHQLNADNFVFSLPKESKYKKETLQFITVSHAIFHNDERNEAPGVVVGYQIAYETFEKIVNKHTKCHSSYSDCYIIDVNGYILYSRYSEHRGKFFGVVEGAIMETMISRKDFRKLSMFDYQAFSEESKPITQSSSSSMLNPINYFKWITQWAISKVLWLLLETNLWPMVYSKNSCSNVDDTIYVTLCQTCEKGKNCPICCKAPKTYSDACQTREEPPHIEKNNNEPDKPKNVPVDKAFSLYLFTNLSAYGDIFNGTTSNENCSRPYDAQRINYTNLILIVVDTRHQSCYKHLDIQQTVIRYKSDYPDIPPCNKKMISSYPRKKLRGCSDKLLPNLTGIEYCGSKSNFTIEINLILGCNILLILFFNIFF